MRMRLYPRSQAVAAWVLPHHRVSFRIPRQSCRYEQGRSVFGRDQRCHLCNSWHGRGAHLEALPPGVLQGTSSHGRDVPAISVQWDTQSRLSSVSFHTPAFPMLESGRTSGGIGGFETRRIVYIASIVLTAIKALEPWIINGDSSTVRTFTPAVRINSICIHKPYCPSPGNWPEDFF